jgi:hypothetical protein
MPKFLAFIALAAAALTTACTTPLGTSLISRSIPFEARQWSEPVQLASGNTIVVERRTVPGRRFYSIDGSTNSYEPEHVLQLPDGTVWNSLKAEPRLTLAQPVVLGLDGNSWVLVLSFSTFGDLVRLGCPVPNFVYFKYSANGWTRVSPASVSDQLAYNLLPLGSVPDRSSAAAISPELKQSILASKPYAKQPFSKYCDRKDPVCRQPTVPECDREKIMLKPITDAM